MTTNQQLQTDRFRIGDFIIDADDNTVSTRTQQRHIEPKAMQVLLELVSCANKTADRKALLQNVWGDRVVVDEALTRVISQLRIAFDDTKSRSLIQTVPKKGYRLNAQVEWLHDGVGDLQSQREESHQATASAQSAFDAGNTPDSPTDSQQDVQGVFSSPVSTYVPKSMLRRRLQGISFFFGIVLIVAVVTWLVDSSDSALIDDAPSVAVLPLTAVSDNAQSRYLAEGLAEELMTALGNTPALDVPSRYSTFAYAQQFKKVTDIASALDVRYLIEGTVRHGDGSYTIVIRLIDAKQDKTLWSSTYEDDESRLAGVSDMIAADVIKQLLPETSSGALSANGRVQNIDAYQAYLKGTYWLMNGKTSEWYLQAEQAFNEAIQADPTYAEAHGSLAYIYARFNYHDTYLPRKEATQKAEDAIATALSLNRNNVQAHLARAIIATSGQAFDVAEEALDTALAISPQHATALYLYSELRLAQNDFTGALEYAKRAKTQDPLSPWVNVNLAIVHYWRGEMEAALIAADDAIAIDDEYTWAYVWKAKALHHQGRLAEAISAMQSCLRIDNSSPVNNAYTGILYLEAGLPESAESLFTAAAALLGDSTDARFWKGFVRFAYEQQNSDVGIAMLEELTLLDNRIFSLIPVLSALYLQNDQSEAGSRFLSQYVRLPDGGEPTVNFLNMHAAAGLRTLRQNVDKESPTPKRNFTVLNEKLLPHFGEVFWLLQDDALSKRQQSLLQKSMQSGWPEYLWAVRGSAGLSQLSGDIMPASLATFDARRRKQAEALAEQQP
ncbi:tetratricopeptide repeat protein [Alteromonas sp. H39]|uniref:tetratricopeptide repeat protein n=1 Tax=Alteromonas sp. H39 TaxID=3389876 RepID=UPI0039E05F5C